MRMAYVYNSLKAANAYETFEVQFTPDRAANYKGLAECQFGPDLEYTRNPAFISWFYHLKIIFFLFSDFVIKVFVELFCKMESELT